MKISLVDESWSFHAIDVGLGESQVASTPGMLSPPGRVGVYHDGAFPLGKMLVEVTWCFFLDVTEQSVVAS